MAGMWPTITNRNNDAMFVTGVLANRWFGKD